MPMERAPSRATGKTGAVAEGRKFLSAFFFDRARRLLFVVFILLRLGTEPNPNTLFILGREEL